MRLARVFNLGLGQQRGLAGVAGLQGLSRQQDHVLGLPHMCTHSALPLLAVCTGRYMVVVFLVQILTNTQYIDLI
jgi:hypothetical protein